METFLGTNFIPLLFRLYHSYLVPNSCPIYCWDKKRHLQSNFGIFALECDNKHKKIKKVL